MRNATIFGLFLLLMVAFVIGCDREVTETVVVTDDGFEDCFTCHGDDGYLLQAKGEWQNSTHASGNNVDYTNRGGTDCTRCHNHQGFLEYLSTGAVSGPYDNVSAIHCFTCHAPHERGDLTLRIDDAVTLGDGDTYDAGGGNLCANCHMARTYPTSIGDNFNVTSTHWGPHHGPQSDVLVSAIGYEYAGYTYTSSNHVGAIENSCVGCHMGNPTQHSGYGVGGHSFNIQDEEGNDISGVCEDCHASADEIDFLADQDYDHDTVIEGYQTEIAGLMDSLGTLLVAEGVLSAASGGHPETGTIADGGVAGALWNYLVVEEDQSHGIHNFNYLQGLLQSSIEYLNSTKSPGIVAIQPAH